MTKQELIRHIATEQGLTHSVVKDVLDSMQRAVIGCIVNGETVNLPEFLKIKQVRREERRYFNLSTGQLDTLEARVRPVAVISKKVLEKL